MVELIDEAKAAVARSFFAALGMAVDGSCRLQYRLAYLYGANVLDARAGHAGRMNERILAALKTTFGGAITLAADDGVLKGPLLADVEIALQLRNYIVHRLFIETRSQHNEQGYPGLAARLRDTATFFLDVGESIDRQHLQIFRDAGVPEEVYRGYRRRWGELADETISPAPGGKRSR